MPLPPSPITSRRWESSVWWPSRQTRRPLATGRGSTLSSPAALTLRNWRASFWKRTRRRRSSRRGMGEAASTPKTTRPHWRAWLGAQHSALPPTGRQSRSAVRWWVGCPPRAALRIARRSDFLPIFVRRPLMNSSRGSMRQSSSVRTGLTTHLFSGPVATTAASTSPTTSCSDWSS